MNQRQPLFLILIFGFLVNVASARYFDRVVIDAGHGGHDRGASRGSVMEKHLALDTARRLERYLNSRGIKTVMTRSRDRYVKLENRAALGNRYPRSIFVSIHYNAARTSSTVGLETFYYGSEGRRLAGQVQGRMMRKVATRDRGVKYAKFHVLRNTRTPAILVEGGFLSNSWERNRCLQPAYRQSIAEGVAEGILAFKASR